MNAIGLLPWALQCLTISDNIFYDNTRNCGNEKASKGILYTIMSRAKKGDQFSFFYPIQESEIKYGVHTGAKKFDDRYRLQEGVIFNLSDEEYS